MFLFQFLVICFGNRHKLFISAEYMLFSRFPFFYLNDTQEQSIKITQQSTKTIKFHKNKFSFQKNIQEDK